MLTVRFLTGSFLTVKAEEAPVAMLFFSLAAVFRRLSGKGGGVDGNVSFDSFDSALLFLPNRSLS